MKASAREQQGQVGPAMVTGVSRRPRDKTGPKWIGESDVQIRVPTNRVPGQAAP